MTEETSSDMMNGKFHYKNLIDGSLHKITFKGSYFLREYNKSVMQFVMHFFIPTLHVYNTSKSELFFFFYCDEL